MAILARFFSVFLLSGLWSLTAVADWPVTTITTAELYRIRSGESRVYHLEENSRVLVFDFADLAEQGAALNRLATFLEKRGGELLDDAGLAARILADGVDPNHYYLGHDYRIADVARFFNTARDRGITLNSSERDLLSKLLASAFLVADFRGLVAREHELVLIGVSQARASEDGRHTDMNERTLTLRHELSHGEFLTNPDFRQYCREFWMGLRPAEREIFREELARLGYDPENEELMVNEMQAFLWEPLAGAFLQARLRKNGSEDLAGLRRRFLSGLAAGPRPLTAFFDLPRHRELSPLTMSSGRAMRVGKRIVFLDETGEGLPRTPYEYRSCPDRRNEDLSGLSHPVPEVPA
ncbi:MAG: hypothetical protein HQL57_08180 [Magnetococcales bacterium]|nr:hypothetical protein [Magnetococcales bacterium]MBF0157145.1 hypothetical protein [Magnetococcales bacterium]